MTVAPRPRVLRRAGFRFTVPAMIVLALLTGTSPIALSPGVPRLHGEDGWRPDGSGDAFRRDEGCPSDGIAPRLSFASPSGDAFAVVGALIEIEVSAEASLEISGLIRWHGRRSCIMPAL